MSHTLHSLLKAIGIDIPSGLQDPDIHNISSDSRCVKEGDLFFGLPGQKANGGSFCNEAFSAGAVAAVVGESARYCIPPEKQKLVVVVPDPEMESNHFKNASQIITSLHDFDPESWGLPRFTEKL